MGLMLWVLGLEVSDMGLSDYNLGIRFHERRSILERDTVALLNFLN